MPAVVAAVEEQSYGWLGWCLAALITIIFVAKLFMEQYEIRKSVVQRTMITQSMTTYKTYVANPRFTPLAEGSSGAWPVDGHAKTEWLLQGDRSR